MPRPASATVRMGRMSLSFERTQSVAIIGGGPGGYEAALAAAQLGAEVTLVERAGVGGSAVITDVVPSKSLIATADAAVAIAGASELGVQLFAHSHDGKPLTPEIAINLSAVNKRLLSLARQQSDDMRASLVEAGVRIISGHGRLEGPGAVVVSTGPGGTDFDRIEADTLVVSVGASPRELPSAKPDGKRILTWTQLYDMKALPEHLDRRGLGRHRSRVRLGLHEPRCEGDARLQPRARAPRRGRGCRGVLEKVFKRGGMTVLSKSRADKVERIGDGVLVTLADGRTVEGSHCLMAVGSVPNTADIGLAEADVQMTESGHIQVNRVARTSVPNIYAAGDCTTFVPLASVASMQGRTAIFHALGDVVIPIDHRRITANIFTAPEIATVGWQETTSPRGSSTESSTSSRSPPTRARR